MTQWVEEEVANRLHYWLETTTEHEIHREVSIPTGRIDLVTESPNGEWYGYEVKRVGPVRSLGQIGRYAQSGVFDYVSLVAPVFDPKLIEIIDDTYPLQRYKGVSRLCEHYFEALRHFAHNKSTPKRVIELIHNKNESLLNIRLYNGVTLKKWIENEPFSNESPGAAARKLIHNSSIEELVDEALEELAWTTYTNSIGIMRVGTGQKDSDSSAKVTANHIHTSDCADPDLIQRSVAIERTDTPSPSPSERELQFEIWKALDGIPEGVVYGGPEGNTSVGIDIINFNGGPTATHVMREGGSVHGIEIKTQKGLNSTERLKDQLERYTEYGMLSKVSVAVPESATDEMTQILHGWKDELSDCIGIIGISDQGLLTTHREPIESPIDYDAFSHKNIDKTKYVGYGDHGSLQELEPESMLDITGF